MDYIKTGEYVDAACIHVYDCGRESDSFYWAAALNVDCQPVRPNLLNEQGFKQECGRLGKCLSQALTEVLSRKRSGLHKPACHVCKSLQLSDTALR